MTTELEKRLAKLEKELIQRQIDKPGKRRRWQWVTVALLLATAVTGITFLTSGRNTQPIPASIRKAASFTLYYPSSIPAGYSYEENSGKVENGIVYFNVRNGDKVIQVSEQPVPPRPPDINNLIGFKKLETLAGSAALGNSAGKPVAVLLTNTTLVTATGNRSVPNDIVGDFIKSMASIPNE